MTHHHLTLGLDLVERLRDAVSRRDLETLVGCFSSDYVNETPVHPSRGFTGSAQVRANWENLFAGLADVTATVLDAVAAKHIDKEVIWTEWRITGRHGDGHDRELRGVIVFEVANGLFSRARFYLEPLDAAGDDVAAAVGRVVHP